MKKEIILTPEELYYMGALLQAKYMDYAYVAAMGDIQQRREIYESEARDGLAKKGFLTEDFMGELTVKDSARRMLEPIFFGELESSLDILITAADKKLVRNNRFHFYEGRIIATAIRKDGIHLAEIDDSRLGQWIGSMLPASYDATVEQVAAENMDRKQISRIFSVKSNRVGERTSVEIYIECGGRVFREQENGMAEAMTREQFNREVYRGLKGE